MLLRFGDKKSGICATIFVAAPAWRGDLRRERGRRGKLGNRTEVPYFARQLPSRNATAYFFCHLGPLSFVNADAPLPEEKDVIRSRQECAEHVKHDREQVQSKKAVDNKTRKLQYGSKVKAGLGRVDRESQLWV